MKQNIKRMLALITVILIVAFVLATLVIAILDFPGKSTVFGICITCLIALPIMAWFLLWMVGVLSNRKNIASFRSAEMEETMQKAEEIKYQKELEKENKNDAP